MTDLSPDLIREILAVSDRKILWKERTPEFYAAHFSRAYAPDGAAASWNRMQAGQRPTWVMTKSADDYTCNAMLTRVTLKAVCEALGAPYDAMRADVINAITKKSADATRQAVTRLVEWDGINYVWKTRTAQTHPNADPRDLIEFNTRYAGKKLTPRKGLYRVSYRIATTAQMSAWLRKG